MDLAPLMPGPPRQVAARIESTAPIRCYNVIPRRVGRVQTQKPSPREREREKQQPVTCNLGQLDIGSVSLSVGRKEVLEVEGLLLSGSLSEILKLPTPAWPPLTSELRCVGMWGIY